MKLTIAQWRRVRGMTQLDLAKALDITAVTLREWERNPGKITVNKLFGMMRLLEIPDVDSIIFLPDDSTNSTESEKEVANE